MSPECSKHQVLSFAEMLVVWWTSISLANHLRSVADASSLSTLSSEVLIATEYMKGEHHKSEVLLTASTLPVVKTESGRREKDSAQIIII